MSDKFERTNFAKLNCIQQSIAEIFEKNELTRPEVYVILKGMREFKMVNKELAVLWWDDLIKGRNGFDPNRLKIDKSGETFTLPEWD